MRPLNRRETLGLLTSFGVVAAGGGALAREGRVLPGDDALQRLVDGNRRFVEGRSLREHEDAAWRRGLVGGQQPFAFVLGCADSRVPPELIFDQGFGDLFVNRLAGNIVDADVVGSLAYGVLVLGVRLALVLGHEECGAVHATLDAMAGRGDPPALVAPLVDAIEPGLRGLDLQQPAGPLEHQAVEANVRWSMAQLTTNTQVSTLLKSNGVRLAGAVYDLESGRVRIL